MIWKKKNIYIVFLVFTALLTSQAHSQELGQGTGVVSVPAPQEGRSVPGNAHTCTSEQIEENKKVIAYCDANWEKWEIEKPPENERRSVHDCSGLFSSTTVSSCGKAILGLPIMAYQLAEMGWNSVFPNKNTFAYVSQEGTLEEITEYLLTEKVTQICGMTPEHESYSSYREQVCETLYQSLEPSDIMAEKMCYDLTADEARKTIRCHESPEAQKFKQEKRQEALQEAQEIKALQEEQKRIAESKKAEMDRVYSICQTHLMPNYSTTEKALMLAVPLYSASAIVLNHAQPSKRAIELFNNCVNEETKGNPELRQELEKSGRGLVEQLTGQLDALQCYDEGSRRELQCELALAAGTLGGSLSVAAAKKLGKKGISAIERRLGRKMLGLADNFRDLRRTAALSDAQRISEASELLGRKLKAYEAKQILDAHKVGSGRPGAGYFNYTSEEIAEKARILEDFTPDERRLLMERGVVGQISSGGDHLGRTFVVRDYAEEIMSLWDESSSYAVQCRGCGFERIKVDDVARGHIAARHEMHNLATQNMNKALNEINELMARTPKGSHISTEAVLRILDKHGVPYLDNGVTSMFPKGTDINKVFENLKNVELKKIGTDSSMRNATDYSAVVNGETYIVRICTSKQTCSRGEGLPAAKEGDVISAYPTCGQGVRLIPKPRDIRNILDNKKQSGSSRVMLADIFPERRCS